MYWLEELGVVRGLRDGWDSEESGAVEKHLAAVVAVVGVVALAPTKTWDEEELLLELVVSGVAGSGADAAAHSLGVAAAAAAAAVAVADVADVADDAEETAAGIVAAEGVAGAAELAGLAEAVAISGLAGYGSEAEEETDAPAAELAVVEIDAGQRGMGKDFGLDRV
jgi:hypothetical protein